MRILYNHGLTAKEIYTNTPRDITHLTLTNFRDTYRTAVNFDHAFSRPFVYCLNLIIDTILTERVRLKLPFKQSYVDFEIVTDDRFIEQRQNGRFQEIDFIESDFTGYFLNYFYWGRNYQKTQPMYLGGKYKKQFLEGINTGTKYYTTKDVDINYFLPKVHEKYNTFKKGDLKKLILLGFRRMHAAIRYGCAVSIRSDEYNFYLYIGSLSLDPKRNIREYTFRKDRKLRKMMAWNKTPYDGFYYIGLTEKTLAEWMEVNKKNKVRFTFKNIVVRKIQEEFYYKAPHVFIFKYPVEKFMSYSKWKEKLTVRDVEYVGEAIDRQFYPANKTLKEFMKNYEKTSSSYV